MTKAYDLSRLDAKSFEHLVNLLALNVLGAGHTGFAPGADRGRDGWFKGEAPYPSHTERWSGTWYIQSKFLEPHLSKNSQKWLLSQIKSEIDAFSGDDRDWPNIWIIATNVDPTAGKGGSFDKAMTMVRTANPKLAERFHIWGGRKLLDFIALNPKVGQYYAEFLTPGQVVSEIYNQVTDQSSSIEEVFRHLTVTQLREQKHTKLEQAGSTTDNRPGLQRLFTDLPFRSESVGHIGMIASTLATASAENHKVAREYPQDGSWVAWQRNPRRARVAFIKGGPGNGKSTVTQYLCQIQRAALVLDLPDLPLAPGQREDAEDIRSKALECGLWPKIPRIPVHIELRDFAQWYGRQADDDPRTILAYLSSKIGRSITSTVNPKTLKRAFKSSRWLFVFDGLDEAPGDVKDSVASEVIHFADDVLIECETDAFVICTSRPQGYSGQFSALDAAMLELVELNAEQALACAQPVLEIDRSPEEVANYTEILREAIASPAIRKIMVTPLQSHIMAVVVRDGGRPPERKWQLFSNFYQVIKKREANRNLPNRQLTKLLREEDRLLKELHNRLGFELHSRAERSEGAQTSLKRDELRRIVELTVRDLQVENVDETVSTLVEATTERLVLVTTPESGDEARFDIRPLQEFFAAEYIYESATTQNIGDRLRLIASDSHWREVVHFLLSALIENNRKSELAIAVEVLADANDEGEIPHQRYLSRRLAFGGTASARLHQEGVLEFDRKVRDQFRRSFSALLGCTDASEFLPSLGREHSAAWLTDVLADTVAEKAESESFGAARVLALLLPSGHRREQEVLERVSKFSLGYRAALVRAAVSDLGKARTAPAAWLCKLAAGMLASDDYKRLQYNSIDALFEAISTNDALVNRALSSIGIAGPASKILASLLDGDYRAYRTIPARDGGRLFGILETRIQNVPGVEPRKWNNKIWNELNKLTGAFSLINLLLRAAVLRDTNSDQTALSMYESNPYLFRALPANVQSFVSHSIRFGGCSDTPSSVTSDHVGQRCDYHFADHPNQADIQWERLCTSVPQAILHEIGSEHISGSLQPGLDKFLDTDSGRQTFLGSIQRNPEHLFESTAHWGKIFQHPAVGRDLYLIALENANRPRPPHIFSYNFKTTQLNLPSDIELLPHVLMAILRVADSYDDGPYYVPGESADRKRFNISGAIKSTVEDADALYGAAYGDYSARARAAAAAMYCLHPDRGHSISKLSPEQLVSFYTPEVGPWFAATAARGMTSGLVYMDASTISAVGELFHAIRDDFDSRLEVDRVIKDWREISRSPVLSSDSNLWI